MTRRSSWDMGETFDRDLDTEPEILKAEKTVKSTGCKHGQCRCEGCMCGGIL